MDYNKIMSWVFLVLIAYSVSVAATGIESVCVYETNGPHMRLVKSADLDKDGVPEIFAGSANGVVYTLKQEDCEEQWSAIWQFIDMADEITGLQVMDFDRDGENEIIISSLDREKYLYVLGLDTSRKWKPKEALDSMYCLHVYDVDGDGENEILLASKQGKIYMMKQEESPWNLKLSTEWVTQLDNPAYYVKALNLDSDPETEIVALANDQRKKATVYVLSAEGNIEWSYEIDKGVYQANDYSISVVNIDLDANKEILVSCYDKKLVALNSRGQVLWTYTTDNLVSSVRVDDLDGNSEKEIILGSYPNLILLDWTGMKKWGAPTDSTILSIELADVNEDGIKEIITGCVKSIKVYSMNGGILAGWNYSTATKQKEINARMIALGDYDADGSLELAAAFGWQEAMLDHNYDQGELRLFELDIPSTAPTTTTVTSTTGSSTTSTLGSTSMSIKPVTRTVQITTTTEPIEDGSGSMLIYLLIGLVVLVFLVLAVGAGLYYMKKKSGKKQETETKKEEETTKEDKENLVWKDLDKEEKEENNEKESSEGTDENGESDMGEDEK